MKGVVFTDGTVARPSSSGTTAGEQRTDPGCRQEQPGFKNRLIAHDFQETDEFQADKLPLRAYYGNEITVEKNLPVRE